MNLGPEGDGSFSRNRLQKSIGFSKGLACVQHKLFRERLNNTMEYLIKHCGHEMEVSLDGAGVFPLVLSWCVCVCCGGLAYLFVCPTTGPLFRGCSLGTLVVPWKHLGCSMACQGNTWGSFVWVGRHVLVNRGFYPRITFDLGCVHTCSDTGIAVGWVFFGHWDDF